MDTDNDGHVSQAQIVKLIEDHERQTYENPAKLKFFLSINEEKTEEIVRYNKLLEYLDKDDNKNFLMEIPKDCITSRTFKERSS
jgi:adenosine/AMP kinase